MGCDGGTIPKRDELVRTKKKPEQKDKRSERAFRYKHCAASQEPLQKPVVACELGRLYNKDTVIEALLDKSKVTQVVSHLRSLKDVKEVNLTDNPAHVADATFNNADADDQAAKWICPVVGQELNGKFRFVFVWTCGCVFSERALKEISKPVNNGDKQECLKCLKPFSMDDVILLNPTEEDEINAAHASMEARRERVKNEKKAKKNGKSATEVAAAPSSTVTSEEAKEQNDDAVPKAGLSTSKLAVGIKRKEEVSGRQVSAEPGSSKKPKVGPTSANAKLTTYSVAKDPKASETFKSLFTTHDSAATQEKAHWITYNPFYN